MKRDLVKGEGGTSSATSDGEEKLSIGVHGREVKKRRRESVVVAHDISPEKTVRPREETRGRGRGICRCERGGGVGAAVLMEKEEEEDKIRGVRLLSPVFHRNRWCSGDEDDKGMKKEGKIG
ncbi:hypothetical protein HAX54_053149 [Datura stramonium]|uniref:Uncharacterized protein n=1 Tax=Datura stramonium TaxID=4076 RepID=A0ABS8SZX7_DATST|nr:hypothetical protein [Datura stramonium]